MDEEANADITPAEPQVDSTLDDKISATSLIMRAILGFVLYGALLFLPAGTWAYSPGWIFFGIIFPIALIGGIFLYKKHPEVLKRRMRIREKEKIQKVIIAVLTAVYFGGFILAGLDFRWGWSQIPLPAVIAANIVVGLSYIGVMWVLVVNEFAGRTIEVEEKQKLISTGPYALVRHPMYSFFLVLTIALGIGLGSYWALLVLALSIPIGLHFRIVYEEKLLMEELEGYNEYCEKVRSRVIPYIW